MSLDSWVIVFLAILGVAAAAPCFLRRTTRVATHAGFWRRFAWGLCCVAGFLVISFLLEPVHLCNEVHGGGLVLVLSSIAILVITIAAPSNGRALLLALLVVISGLLFSGYTSSLEHSQAYAGLRHERVNRLLCSVYKRSLENLERESPGGLLDTVCDAGPLYERCPAAKSLASNELITNSRTVLDPRTLWHTWLTGLHERRERPIEVWISAGRLRDSLDRLEIRVREL